jgi:hypothetical protein
MPRPSCRSRAEKAGAKGDALDKICDMGIERVCSQFKANPGINPLTGRTIALDGPLGKMFESLCKVKEPQREPQRESPKPPLIVNQPPSPEQLEKLKNQVILSVRDEMIIKVGNSIRNQVYNEVTAGLKDEIQKHVLVDMKQVVLTMVNESISSSLSAQLKKTFDDQRIGLSDKAKVHILNDLKAEMKNIWNTVLEKEILEKLETSTESLVEKIIEPRIRKFEEKVELFTSNKLPEKLFGKKIMLFEIASPDPLKVLIQKEHGLFTKIVNPGVCDIAVVKDKDTKVPQGIKASIVLTLADFNDYYFPFLPKCQSNRMFAGMRVTFQPGFISGKIKHYVEKCGGEIVPPTMPDISIVVTNPGNPSIDGVFIGKNTLVFTRDEFFARYMYRCKRSGLFGKTVAFYGFLDAELRDHINHCNCKFIDDAESIKVKDYDIPIDYIIYKGVNGNVQQTAANRKAAENVTFIKHQLHELPGHKCTLIEYTDFLNEFINISNDVFQKRVGFQKGYSNELVEEYVLEHEGILVTEAGQEIDLYIQNPRKPRDEWFKVFKTHPGTVKITGSDFMLKYMFNCSTRLEKGTRQTLDRKTILLYKFDAPSTFTEQLELCHASVSTVIKDGDNFNFILYKDVAEDVVTKDRGVDKVLKRGNCVIMDYYEFVEMFSRLRIKKIEAKSAKAQPNALCNSLDQKGIALFDCANDTTLISDIKKCNGTLIDLDKATKAIDVIVYKNVDARDVLKDAKIKSILKDNRKTQVVSYDELMSNYINAQTKKRVVYKCEKTDYLRGKTIGFHSDLVDADLVKLIEQCGANVIDGINIGRLDFLVYNATKPPGDQFIEDALKRNEDLEIVNDTDFYNNFVNGDNLKVLSASKQKALGCLSNKLVHNKRIAFYSGYSNARLETKIEKCGGIIAPLDYADHKTRIDYIVYRSGSIDIVKNDSYIKDFIVKQKHLVCISDVDFTQYIINGAQKTWANLPWRLITGKKNKDAHFFMA